MDHLGVQERKNEEEWIILDYHIYDYGNFINNFKGVSMNWIDIYKKYKDTEGMKEFEHFLEVEKYHPKSFQHLNIKGIWGYLICYSETKGRVLYISKAQTIDQWIMNLEHDTVYTDRTLEQAMLWCASKFFEITNCDSKKEVK